MSGKIPFLSRPTGHVVPRRRPRFGFGDVLRDAHGFTGRVTAIYADIWAARDGRAIQANWWERQKIPPSTKDQVFYVLAGLDGEGATLTGERDVEPVDVAP